MDRIARNHDVSRQSANHKIIIRLDHGILLRECHIGGVVVQVEREEQNEWAVSFRSAAPSYVRGRPASNLQVTSCCSSKRLKHIAIFLFLFL